jgi:acyl-CoA thioesterase
MAGHFIDLQATHNPHRWYLPLHEGLCVGPPGNSFMFGGVGLGASIRALEGACQRPVIWAAAQYLSYARPSSVVDFDVIVPAHGKHTSQARVIAHVGDKEILTVNAALGLRPSELDLQWAVAPEAPPPEECRESARWRSNTEDLHTHIEVRVARGRLTRSATPQDASPDGRVVLWARPRGGQIVDAAMLAIMADHAPAALGDALGRYAGGNSLDNTLRVLTITPTPWVLLDIAIIGVANGVAHGAVRLFAMDGRLMATASQSMILRLHDAEG